MPNVTVESGWTHKEAGAELLGVSIRQLENLAALGRIRKNRLPRQANERSARVLYLIEDIEAIKAGNPRLPEPSAASAETTPAVRANGRDSVPWGDLIEQLSAIARAVPSPDRQTEQLDAMVAAISRAFAAPAQEREAAATERERAMMASIDRFIELLATRQAERAQELNKLLELLAPMLASLAEFASRNSKADPKPWLSIDAAVEYSGLSRAYLLGRARDGWNGAINVSVTGGRARWRFNREAIECA
jgi:hypothetical protein